MPIRAAQNGEAVAGDDRHREIDPDQHHQHRNGAHGIDVEDQRHAQPGGAVHPAEPDGQTQHQAANHRQRPKAAASRRGRRQEAPTVDQRREIQIHGAASDRSGQGARRRCSTTSCRCILVSSAVSSGCMRVSTALSHAKNSGWFLSMAKPMSVPISLLSWQLLPSGSAFETLHLLVDWRPRECG